MESSAKSDLEPAVSHGAFVRTALTDHGVHDIVHMQNIREAWFEEVTQHATTRWNRPGWARTDDRTGFGFLCNGNPAAIRTSNEQNRLVR